MLLIPTVCFLLLAFWPGAFGQGTGGFSLSPFTAAYQGFVVTALGQLVGGRSIARSSGTSAPGSDDSDAAQ
jgi:hypothetical protein